MSRLPENSNILEYLTAIEKLGAKWPAFYWEHANVYSPAPTGHGGGAAKQCYMNAGRLALDEGLIYCEGLATPPGLFPMHHAWVLSPQGQVLDPTWDSDPPALEYFGVAFKNDFLLDWTVETHRWGILGEMVPTKLLELPVEKWKHSTAIPK